MKVAILSILISITSSAHALKNGQYFTSEQFSEPVGINQNRKNICSATKVAPKLYLTAAHCIKVLDLSDRLKQRIFIKQSLKSFTANIEEIYFHPTVDLSSFSNGDHPQLRLGEVVGHIFGSKVIDLAIFKIKQEFPEINSMALYSGKLEKKQIIQLAAYGDTGNGYGGLDPRWGEQQIRKVGKTFIKIKHSKKYPAEVMPGDSGSPLIVTIEGQKFLAGVASWKKPGILGGAGYFISPENFVSWTQDVIDQVMIPNLVFTE